MTVLIFGAISSPSIANYVLRTIGTRTSSSLFTQTLHRNFYVDDCLRSVESIDVTKALIQDLRQACCDGGFRLTKFICKQQDVMISIPQEEHSKEMETRYLNFTDLPVTRVLGVLLSIEFTNTSGNIVYCISIV